MTTPDAHKTQTFTCRDQLACRMLLSLSDSSSHPPMSAMVSLKTRCRTYPGLAGNVLSHLLPMLFNAKCRVPLSLLQNRPTLCPRKAHVALQTPVRWYFGREIARSNRQIVTRYALPQRSYIGPTSMDAEMAFVICNMARVRPASGKPSRSRKQAFQPDNIVYELSLDAAQHASDLSFRKQEAFRSKCL